MFLKGKREKIVPKKWKNLTQSKKNAEKEEQNGKEEEEEEEV